MDVMKTMSIRCLKINALPRNKNMKNQTKTIIQKSKVLCLREAKNIATNFPRCKFYVGMRIDWKLSYARLHQFKKQLRSFCSIYCRIVYTEKMINIQVLSPTCWLGIFLLDIVSQHKSCIRIDFRLQTVCCLGPKFASCLHLC